MISFNHILRKCTGGYQLHKSQNQPPYVNGHQTLGLKKERIEKFTIGSDYIKSGYRDGIRNANNEK